MLCILNIPQIFNNIQHNHDVTSTTVYSDKFQLSRITHLDLAVPKFLHYIQHKNIFHTSYAFFKDPSLCKILESYIVMAIGSLSPPEVHTATISELSMA